MCIPGIGWHLKPCLAWIHLTISWMPRLQWAHRNLIWWCNVTFCDVCWKTDSKVDTAAQRIEHSECYSNTVHTCESVMLHHYVVAECSSLYIALECSSQSYSTEHSRILILFVCKKENFPKKSSWQIDASKSKNELSKCTDGTLWHGCLSKMILLNTVAVKASREFSVSLKKHNL
jgi:hypothetical protein